MIFLAEEQLKQIIDHCKKEYPKEACGILAGKIVKRPTLNIQRKVTKVYKMTNTSESPETCYFMQPEEQFKIFKEMRKLEIEIHGIYHSHADTSAYPSKRDCDMAFYPEAYYMIVSLKDCNNPEVRAFRIVEGEIEEVGVKGE